MSWSKGSSLWETSIPQYEYLHHFCAQAWELVPSLVLRHEYLYHFLCSDMSTYAISCVQACTVSYTWVRELVPSAQMVMLGPSLTFGHECLCHILHHVLHPGMNNCTISYTWSRAPVPSLLSRLQGTSACHLLHPGMSTCNISCTQAECLHYLLCLDTCAWAISCTWVLTFALSLTPRCECLCHLLWPGMKTCAISCTWAWALIPSLMPRYEQLHPS